MLIGMARFASQPSSSRTAPPCPRRVRRRRTDLGSGRCILPRPRRLKGSRGLSRMARSTEHAGRVETTSAHITQHPGMFLMPLMPFPTAMRHEDPSNSTRLSRSSPRARRSGTPTSRRGRCRRALTNQSQPMGATRLPAHCFISAPGKQSPRLGALSKASPMATRTEEMALGDNLRVSFDGARLISGEDKAGEDHAAN
jgi:hypothetical protein